MVYKTRGARQTQKIAQKTAARLKPGDIVALYGELGSGKTTFIQGLAKGLGVRETVGSPTYVLVKFYALPARAGLFVHADLYRLKTTDDVETTGLFDYLGSPYHIVAIEWPEVIARRLPEKTQKIYFESKDEITRKIIIH